ncbi:MAG: 2OG-Fe(II) oxygenase [Sphingopyxis sp.]|nr:2OG-Fe(II) oxygenase [Sphingopyxis sp.]
MVTPASLSIRARRLLEAGDTSEAIELVSDAARRGDGEALNELGLWHVYGQPLQRDFARARLFFGHAGRAGYKPATTTYAVFVALGAGGEPRWKEAFGLLEAAAPEDAMAARQVELLRAMDIGGDGRPRSLPAEKVLARSPVAARRSRLFSPAECAHVIDLATPFLAPSVVVDSRTGRQSPNPIRTSFNAVLGPIQQDLVLHALNLRLAAATGTDVEAGEPLIVLRYEPGQQYREHHDCLPGEANQRVRTAIVYLNEDYQGGETSFPAAGLDIKGRTGDMLTFANTRPDGQVDLDSRHIGQAVTKGTKWICTRWIRRARFDPWGLRTPSPLIR